MTMPGVGAMLHNLSGGSPKDPKYYYGRKITDATIGKINSDYDGEKEDALLIQFEDGTTIKIWDDGQSCCESRYMTCDDEPKALVGGVLVSIDTEDGGSKDDSYEVHEQVFIKIQTDQISITLTTHNEHNGHYDGFGLSLDEVKDDSNSKLD